MSISVQKNEHSILLLTPQAEAIGIQHEHFEPQYLLDSELVTKTARGRGKVYFFDWHNSSLVLRHYMRGGLVSKLSNDKYLFNGITHTRCYQELEILSTLVQNGVNTPQPIAGRVIKHGVRYTADIITQAIPNAQELHAIIQKQAVDSSVWQKIGEQIKKLHQQQICHDDINVKNVLLADQQKNQATNHPNTQVDNLIENQQSVFLIDFDKCSLKQGESWKPANLARFKRSIDKQQQKYAQYHVTNNDWEALLAAYNK